MHSPFSLIRAVALLLACSLAPIGMIGMCCVVTWQGRLLFFCLGLLGVAPMLWWIADERGSIVQTRLSQAMLIASFGGIGLVGYLAPDGHSPDHSRVHSRYSEGGWHYPSHAWGNLVAEMDQIHLGYGVANVFDPLFNRNQLRELAAMTDTLYAEMETDGEFASIGSGLTQIYREATLAEFRDGHYFHYIPAKIDRAKPAPVLVFLHGSGGNFKAYLWLLSKMADEAGCTLVLPSFGLGAWEKRGGYETITKALADAGKHAAIDPDQIHLMGLSNGGRGVCLAESVPGPKFRTLIMLSAVFHSRMSPDAFAARLKPRPVLVISGGSDDRVPWSYVEDYATGMRQSGLDVTLEKFPDDDHFLFFRKRDDVHRLVVQWLKDHGPAHD